jgi:hypothetical protein
MQKTWLIILSLLLILLVAGCSNNKDEVVDTDIDVPEPVDTIPEVDDDVDEVETVVEDDSPSIGGGGSSGGSSGGGGGGGSPSNGGDGADSQPADDVADVEDQATEICGNGLDDDNNDAIDKNGGCDVDGDAHIDYECGCDLTNDGSISGIEFGSYFDFGKTVVTYTFFDQSRIVVTHDNEQAVLCLNAAGEKDNNLCEASEVCGEESVCVPRLAISGETVPVTSPGVVADSLITGLVIVDSGLKTPNLIVLEDEDPEEIVSVVRDVGVARPIRIIEIDVNFLADGAEAEVDEDTGEVDVIFADGSLATVKVSGEVESLQTYTTLVQESRKGCVNYDYLCTADNGATYVSGESEKLTSVVDGETVTEETGGICIVDGDYYYGDSDCLLPEIVGQEVVDGIQEPAVTLYACSDGVDNDGDIQENQATGGIDFTGGCLLKDIEGDGMPTEFASCHENGASTPEDCFNWCNERQAIYFEPDSDCESVEDKKEGTTISRCSDGVDNDGDEKVDAYGACKVAEKDVNGNAIVSIVSCSDKGLTSKADCKAMCDGQFSEGTFIEPDTACKSLTDDSEVYSVTVKENLGEIGLPSSDEVRTYECSDSVDNDGDGTFDLLGGCLVSTPVVGLRGVITIETHAESCLDQGYETAEACKRDCKVAFGGDYIGGDSQCSSFDDNSETTLKVAESTAPISKDGPGRLLAPSAEEEGFFAKVWNLLFRADRVLQ